MQEAVMKTREVTRTKGFTLIELLAVVAVLSLLAAISQSVFARVRESGRQSVCASNLKQIALAVQQYMQDSDGRSPSNAYVMHRNTPQEQAVFWRDALMPYLKSRAVFRCPSATNREFPGNDYGYNWARLNQFVWTRGGNYVIDLSKGVHEVQVPLASATWLNADTSSYDPEGPGEIVNVGRVAQPSSNSCGRLFVGGTLHSDGANYSFLDGHVKWLTPEQMGEIECQNPPLTLPLPPDHIPAP
jgi:prepilin-type N-terminal cleavage/methylation domain-containing protein/prepilin-type processing-associated H-X9-DG protein